jgi:hypothetical protein
MSTHIIDTAFILLRRFLLNGEEVVVPSAEIDRCRSVYVNWLHLGVFLHAESHSRKGVITDFLQKYRYSHGNRFHLSEWHVL